MKHVIQMTVKQHRSRFGTTEARIQTNSNADITLHLTRVSANIQEFTTRVMSVHISEIAFKSQLWSVGAL